jgi:hypothetical protein
MEYITQNAVSSDYPNYLKRKAPLERDLNPREAKRAINNTRTPPPDSENDINGSIIPENSLLPSKDQCFTLTDEQCLREIGSEGSNSEIYSQILRLEDQAGQAPTIERDSNHTKHPSPSIALHKSGSQNRCSIMDLLNPDTDAQRANFAELSEGQCSMTVSQLSMPPSASNTSLAHVEGCRYLKNAPTLQERAEREQQAAREQQEREQQAEREQQERAHADFAAECPPGPIGHDFRVLGGSQKPGQWDDLSLSLFKRVVVGIFQELGLSGVW